VLDFTECQFGFTGGCRNGSEAAETDGVEGAIVIATMRIISVGNLSSMGQAGGFAEPSSSQFTQPRHVDGGK
jgi:hypothetical protein